MSIRPQDIPEPDEVQAVRAAAAGEGGAGGGGRTKRKRWIRWPIRFAVGGVLLLALLVALLPTLLGTGPGTRFLVGQINKTIPGRVEVDDLKLAWIKGQSLEGLTLVEPSGAAVASLDRVALEDVGLIGLLRGSREWGIVVVEGGAVNIVEDGDGETNLDRALGTSVLGRADPEPSSVPPRPKPERGPTRERGTAEKNAPWLPADARLAFALRHVEVSVTGPTLPDVRVTVPEATVTADGPTKLGFTLDAEVARGDDRGEAKLVGTANQLFDADGRLTLATAEFDIEGVVSHVPLAALDRLIARGSSQSSGVPRLQTVIGPTLDAEVTVKGPIAAIDAIVTVSSENLNIHQGLVAGKERVAATDESRSTLRLTPDSWRELSGSSAPRLVEPFTLFAEVNALDAPLQGQTLDWSATSYALYCRLNVGDSIVLEVEDRGRVVTTPTVVISSDRADHSVAVWLDGDIDAYGRTGYLETEWRIQRGSSGWNESALWGFVHQLPMPVLDALFNQGERLTATFGTTVEMLVTATADGRGGYALGANFNHKNGASVPMPLAGTMAGRYEPDGAVSLKTDERLRLTLTPDAFAQWMRPVAAAAEMGESVGLSLPESADVLADLDLRFALVPGAGLRFDPERTSVVAKIDLPDTKLYDEWYHRGFPLRHGKIQIDAPDLRQPITAEVSFETDAPPESSSESNSGKGKLNADVRLTGAMLDDGYIQLERGKVSGEVELDRVPTVVFDALSRQRGYAVAAFGESLSATINLDDWNFAEGGSAKGELESANGSLLSFSGVDRDGYFEIDRPVTFFLNQTPELSSKILRFLNPILLPAVVSATVPMTVTIDDDGFRLPTRDFDVALIDADIQVQMGTVKIVPTVAPVDKILPQLQTLGVIERASIYEAKVSPIALAIREGVFGYEDLSFKIDDVTLGFGGTISLVDRSLDLGMSLGGKAIEGDPLIKRLVGEGIKVRGTVQEPEVNLASVLNAFSKERLPQTLGGILEGVLQKELKRGEPDPVTPNDGGGGEASEPSATPESEPAEKAMTPEQAIGGFLGELLNREIEKAQERNRRKNESTTE